MYVALHCGNLVDRGQCLEKPAVSIFVHFILEDTDLDDHTCDNVSPTCSISRSLQIYSHTRIRKCTVLPKVAGFSPKNYIVCLEETNQNGSHVHKPV